MKFCPGCGVKITLKTTKLVFDPTSLFNPKKIIEVCVECGQVLQKQQ